MPMQEVWRPVPGFPDYEVSNWGQVASYKRGQRRILRDLDASRGYRKVILHADRRMNNRRLHRLVAEAFIGPRPEGMQIRHLDGVKTHNYAWNLAYGTQSDNAFDMVYHGNHNQASKTECPQGHPYDDLNTYMDPSGRRRCRTCRTEQGQSRRSAVAA